ncbi:MAG: hypothetical protein ACOCTP_02110 [Roseicyclus sp.]
MTYPTHEEMVADAKAGLTIARHGSQHWAVIRSGDVPMVVYADLTTKEAAEIALDVVAEQIADNGHVYGPSEIPSSHFERPGWALKCLREAGVEHHDLMGLAFRLVNGRDDPEAWEIPF